MKEIEVPEIQSRIQKLMRVLTDIRPLSKIHMDTLEHNDPHVQKICRFIDEMVCDAESERSKFLEEIEGIKHQITQYCHDLELVEPVLTPTTQLAVYKLQAENEFAAVNAVRIRAHSEIKSLKKQIGELLASIGELGSLSDVEKEGCAENDSNVTAKDSEITTKINNFPGLSGDTQKKMHHLVLDSEDISVKRIKGLNSLKEALEVQLQEKESKRQQYYERIEEICDILDRTYDMPVDGKICELERMKKELERVLQDRMEEHGNICKRIRELEAELALEPYPISGKLDDTTIAAMIGYVKELENEHQERFNEIFTRTAEELSEISKIFGLEMAEYAKTEEELIRMKKEIGMLLPKKSLFCEILSTIEKRVLLLEKMTEFEKIASDPKRLFKSSFQLNSEEKFRNTAYPTLLRFEDSLFDLIDRYESQFGPFMYEQQDFRKALKEEIDNRIINRTVFISRCDSPYRRKMK